MTSAAVSGKDEICELTIDELDQAGGGMFPPGPTVVDAGVFHIAGVIVQGYDSAIEQRGSASNTVRRSR